MRVFSISRVIQQILVTTLIFQAVTPVTWAQKNPQVRVTSKGQGVVQISDEDAAKAKAALDAANGGAVLPKTSPPAIEAGNIISPISPEESCLKKLVNGASMENLSCRKYLPLDHKSIPLSLVFHALRSLDQFDTTRVSGEVFNEQEQQNLWVSARRNIQVAMQIMNAYPRHGMPRVVRMLLNKALQEMPDFGPDRSRWMEFFLSKQASLAPFLISRFFVNEAYMLMRFRPGQNLQGDLAVGARGGVGLNDHLGPSGAIPALIYRHLFPVDDLAPEGQTEDSKNELVAAGKKGQIILPSAAVAGSYGTENFVINEKSLSVSQTALSSELDERARVYAILVRGGLSEKIATMTSQQLIWGFNTLVPSTLELKPTGEVPPPGTTNPGGPSHGSETPLDPLLDPTLTAADAFSRAIRSAPPPVVEQLIASRNRRQKARIAEINKTSLGQMLVYAPDLDGSGGSGPNYGGQSLTYIYNRHLDWTLLMQAVVDPDSIKYDLQLQEFLKHVVLRYPVLRLPYPGSEARKKMDAEAIALFETSHPHKAVRAIVNQPDPDAVPTPEETKKPDTEIVTDFSVRQGNPATSYKSIFGNGGLDDSGLVTPPTPTDAGTLVSHLYQLKRLRSTPIADINGLTLVSRVENDANGQPSIVYEVVSYLDRNWVFRLETWRLAVAAFASFNTVMKAVRWGRSGVASKTAVPMHAVTLFLSTALEKRRTIIAAETASNSTSILVDTNGNATQKRTLGQRLGLASIAALEKSLSLFAPPLPGAPPLSEYQTKYSRFLKVLETSANVGGIYKTDPATGKPVLRGNRLFDLSHKNALRFMAGVQVMKSVILWNESSHLLHDDGQRTDAAMQLWSEILRGMAYGIDNVRLPFLRGRYAKTVLPIGRAAFALDAISIVGGWADIDIPNTGEMLLKTMRGIRDLWDMSTTSGRMKNEDFQINAVENDLGLQSGPEGCEDLGIQKVIAANRSNLMNLKFPCKIMKDYIAGWNLASERLTKIRRAPESPESVQLKSAAIVGFQNNERILRERIENMSLAMLQTIYVVQLRRFNHPSAALGWTTDYYYRVIRNLTTQVNKIQRMPFYKTALEELGTHAAQ